MRLYKHDRLSVRLLAKKDASLLVNWLSDPNILKYYEGRDRPQNDALITQNYYERGRDITQCLIEYDRKPIGYAQFYPLANEERIKYGYQQNEAIIYGMDQFIGESDYWNQGIGTQLVKSMLDYLVERKQAEKVVMDPQTWNERAIACYEKCGFKKIKILPKHEWHEGMMRDCRLMEYTAKGV